MGIRCRSTILGLLLAGFLFTTGCETTESKKPASLPAQANAPDVTAPAQSAKQQPKIQEQPKPKPANDPADALIAQAEKLLQPGQANYQAGHLEAAKRTSIRHSTCCSPAISTSATTSGWSANSTRSSRRFTNWRWSP